MEKPIGQVTEELAEKVDVPAESEETPAPVEDTTPAQAAADTPEERCARCHFPAHMDAPKVDQKVLEEYVRCMLANRTFKHTYKAFGGQLQLTMESLTTKQSGVYENALAKLRDIVNNAPVNPMTYNAHLAEVRLLMHLRGMQRGDNKEEFSCFDELTFEDHGMSPDQYSGMFGDSPEDLTAIMGQVSVMFANLLLTLNQQALDANFWKGAGLG